MSTEKAFYFDKIELFEMAAAAGIPPWLIDRVGTLSDNVESLNLNSVQKSYVDNRVDEVRSRVDYVDNQYMHIVAHTDDRIDDCRRDLTGLVSQVYADVSNGYLSKQGGIVEDNISSPEPINNNHLTNKLYVDNRINTIVAGYLPLSGGTLTGNVNSPYPVQDSHLANRKYVDDRVVNLMPKVGGVFTGTVSGVVPTNPEHLSTKKYVDDAIVDAKAFTTSSINALNPIGTIIRVAGPYDIIPNYISCTGGSVPIDSPTWAALYNKIGYTYTPTYPSDLALQHVVNANSSITNVSNFELSYSNLPENRDNAVAMVIKDFIYVLGGKSTDTSFNTVSYRAMIDYGGGISRGWEQVDCVTGISGHQMLYMAPTCILQFGGTTSVGVTDSIRMHRVREDGYLIDYGEIGQLPQKLHGARAFALGNVIYITGGFNGSSTVNTMYKCYFDSVRFRLTPWQLAGTLPNGNTSLHHFARLKNNLYLIGGRVLGTSKVYNTVHRAEIRVDNSLGPWVLVNSVNGRHGGACVCSQDTIWLFGGSRLSNSTPTTDIVKGVVDVNNNITWSITTMPFAAIGLTAVCVGGSIHVMGGLNSNKVATATCTGGSNYHPFLMDNNNRFNIPLIDDSDGVRSYIKYR